MLLVDDLGPWKDSTCQMRACISILKTNHPSLLLTITIYCYIFIYQCVVVLLSTAEIQHIYIYPSHHRKVNKYKIFWWRWQGRTQIYFHNVFLLFSFLLSIPIYTFFFIFLLSMPIYAVFLPFLCIKKIFSSLEHVLSFLFQRLFFFISNGIDVYNILCLVIHLLIYYPDSFFYLCLTPPSIHPPLNKNSKVKGFFFSHQKLIAFFFQLTIVQSYLIEISTIALERFTLENK